MKKSLIALAVMAAAGAASAQSSVTLFGIVDASITRVVTHGGTNNTIMSNSGYNSSRLGFRGTEDLGGGMSASFWLEGALSNDDGTPAGLQFQRRSTVSLAGGWGELRLGRDYTPTFWNMTVFDPFGTNGVGQNIGHKVRVSLGAEDPKYVRSSNMIGYFLPANLGGIYGQLNFAFDETTGTANDDAGRYIGARLGYGSGPFNVAVSFGRTDGENPVTDAQPDVRNWNVGGHWDFGMAKAMAIYENVRYEGATGDARLRTWLLGALVPVGAGEIRVSYGRSQFRVPGEDPRVDQLALGYVHNLSKRTAVYTTWARLRNRGGADISIGSVPGVANTRGTGFDLGIRHSF